MFLHRGGRYVIEEIKSKLFLLLINGLSLLFTVTGLLDVGPSLAGVYRLAASLCHRNVDPTINELLNETLVKLLSGGRAAHVVKLLHTAILNPESKDEGASSARSSKFDDASEGLSSLIPTWFLGLHSPWQKLTRSLLQPLQNPALNKQLAYVLLDQIAADLFPEIA